MPAAQLMGMLGITLAFATLIRDDNRNFLSIAVAVLVIAALAFGAPSEIRPRQLAVIAVAILMSVLIYQIVFYQDAVAECRIDKCSPFGGLWHSYLPQENNLGLLVATLVPLLAFLGRRKTRWFALGIALALLVGSGSRTAQLMAVVAYLGYLLIRNNENYMQSPRSTLRAFLRSVPLLSIIASVIIMLESQLNLFTNRGDIAQIVLRGFREEPVFGPGRSILYRAYEERVTGRYILVHEHGQLPYLMTNVGIVGCIFFFLILAAWISSKSLHPLSIALFSTVAVGFVTEPMWEINVATPYFWTLALWLVILRLSSQRAKVQSVDKPANSARPVW